eukprot:scaffold661159_cov57-Prasinocladus_malaysianus.AAC.1
MATSIKQPIFLDGSFAESTSSADNNETVVTIGLFLLDMHWLRVPDTHAAAPMPEASQNPTATDDGIICR